uniref:Uncharacterized protein n=1 Tax=Arundo donax TaxID=35708 RepID=A0A0A9C604_ARUDO
MMQNNIHYTALEIHFSARIYNLRNLKSAAKQRTI